MSFPRKKFLETITYHEGDWDELQNNIGNYYDPLITTIQDQVALILANYLTFQHRTEPDPHPNITIDYIKQGTAYKKLTAAQTSFLDIYIATFGSSPSMNNIPQGTTFKKLSAAEYAKFLTGFYDILDSGATVKFGHNRNIDGFYFAKGGDADGANIYGNDLFSRGYPVYVLVYASPWHSLATGANTGTRAHSLGYRPSFGMLQTSLTDPTGVPEEYIYTDGYPHRTGAIPCNSYAAWNNTYYRIWNGADFTSNFRVLLFAYLGA